MSSPARLERAPRAVFCVIADEHRSRAVAEEVCAGRFTLNGVTLDLGLDPDWRNDGLADDEEWRIEWVKAYWGLDLAHAFAETGDRQLLDTWVRLVGGYARAAPVGFDPSEVSARRIQNWIYAWRRFSEAPAFIGLGEGAAASLVERLAADVDHLAGALSAERNHRTLELYALFVADLALPELDPGGRRAARTLALLGENAAVDLLADGVQRERSTHYHLLVLRSFLGAWENARRFGVALPAGFTDAVERAAEFARWVHRPDGQIPALSDADNGAYLDLLALAARLAGRPELGPAAAPASTSRAFPDGGYHVQRSGWGPDAHHLVFDCGPLGDGGHGHYDQLSVEVSLAGRAVLVDPGRFTYADTAERRWFKSTAAHNTVTVDGLDQAPYRRGKPKGPLPQARLLRTHAEPGLEVLTGQATSPCYDAVHTREVAFVARRLWVVVDRLEAPGPHRYEQRWHLAPEALGALRLDGASAVAPGVALTVAGADSLQVEDGWASPRYGVRQPAPVVAAVAHGAVVELVTVIAEAPAALVVRRLDPDAVELTLDAAPVGWRRR